MTDNNQDIKTTEKKHQPSGKRRALMKGAAVVPVVLTLRSGAAFAAVSTESCIVRDNKNAGNIKPAVLVNTGANDTWLRRPGFYTELEQLIIPTLKRESSSIPSRVSTVSPSISDSPSKPAIASRPGSGDSSGFSNVAQSARPSISARFVVYTQEDPRIHPNALWQHELNIPNGSSNETYVISDIDNKLMEPATRRDQEVYKYGTITECEILIHIDPDTNLSDPSNFKVGAANVLGDGESLPHISGSCWASIGAAATSPSRI
ncbi:MAG: hypothetical protein GQ529_02645 [Methyloprofundus sp.]|nr:hypothetical protein [Methyloprofundus sp.]